MSFTYVEANVEVWARGQNVGTFLQMFEKKSFEHSKNGKKHLYGCASIQDYIVIHWGIQSSVLGGGGKLVRGLNLRYPQN